MVNSPEQLAIVIRKACEVSSLPCDTVREMAKGLEVCSDQSLCNVQKACRGLAGLMGAMYFEWCRAENSAGLRTGLIAAAAETDVNRLVKNVCPTVLEHVDVTHRSIFLLQDHRLVLTATTAPVLYVREVKGGAMKPVPSSQLVDKAYYEVGEGLTGRVAKGLRPVCEDDATRGKNWWGKYSETPVTCRFVGIPLLRHGTLYGVLRTPKLREYEPVSAADYQLLLAFAEELSIAINEKDLADKARLQVESPRGIDCDGA